jgi:hypothetical protein
VSYALREDRFAAEAKSFVLRFRCAACAHVVPSTRVCSLRYPNEMLRGPVRGIGPTGLPLNCKYFELGETLLED